MTDIQLGCAPLGCAPGDPSPHPSSSDPASDPSEPLKPAHGTPPSGLSLEGGSVGSLEGESSKGGPSGGGEGSVTVVVYHAFS